MRQDEKDKSLNGTFTTYYRQKLEENGLTTIFVTGMLIIMFVSVIFALFTEGDTFLNMLHPNELYVFMDHFTMVVAACENPYTEQGVIYPPLIMIIYGIIGNYTIPHTLDPTKTGWDLAVSMRSVELPMIVFVMIIMALLISFYMIYQKYAGNDLGQRGYNAVFITLLFSYPVLFGLSTGNCIFLSVLCCVLYIYCYDSDNKWVKIFSYICLGFAAGVKITPAFLAVLTLKHKGWREFFTCFVIVSAILVVPFIFKDGDPITFLNNILSYGYSVPDTFGILNINGIMKLIGADVMVTIGVEILVMGAFLLLIIMDHKMPKWEEVTLLGVMLMLVFSVSVPYTYLYMVLGLMLLLSTRIEPDKGSVFCIICFIGIMALVPGFELGQKYIGTAKMIIMLALVIYLFWKSVNRIRSHDTNEIAEEPSSKKRAIKAR